MAQRKRPEERIVAGDGAATKRTRSGTIAKVDPRGVASSDEPLEPGERRKPSSPPDRFQRYRGEGEVPKESGTLPILQDRDEKPRASAAAPYEASVIPTASRAPAFNEALLLARTGGILLLAFAAQAWLRIEWPGLSRWQALDTYKIATGALLGAYLLGQWSLTFARIGGMNRLAKLGYVWHQRNGVLAPVLLFLHSTSFGVGYLTVLTGVFLGNTLCGLTSPRASARLRRYMTGWLVTHIALSVTVVVLTAYHVWVAFYYE